MKNEKVFDLESKKKLFSKKKKKGNKKLSPSVFFCVKVGRGNNCQEFGKETSPLVIIHESQRQPNKT